MDRIRNCKKRRLNHFFNSGKEEHHSYSVGVVIKKKGDKALVGWKPILINNLIITVQFDSQHPNLTIIQCAPTKVATTEDTFYDKLQETFDILYLAIM